MQSEARKANHDEVVEEDRKSKLPRNYEGRRRRAEWELENEAKKKVLFFLVGLTSQEAEEKGEDYKRIKALSVTAEEQETRERLAKKRTPDEGFAGSNALGCT